MTAELWVARDGNGIACLHSHKPLWDAEVSSWVEWDAEWLVLPDGMFPEIAPGECRRVTLTLSPAPAPDTRTREGE